MSDASSSTHTHAPQEIPSWWASSMSWAMCPEDTLDTPSFWLPRESSRHRDAWGPRRPQAVLLISQGFAMRGDGSGYVSWIASGVMSPNSPSMRFASHQSMLRSSS